MGVEVDVLGGDVEAVRLAVAVRGGVLDSEGGGDTVALKLPVTDDAIEGVAEGDGDACGGVAVGVGDGEWVATWVDVAPGNVIVAPGCVLVKATEVDIDCMSVCVARGEGVADTRAVTLEGRE